MDLKARNRAMISSLAGRTQDCLHVLINLLCGKNLRRKQSPRSIFVESHSAGLFHRWDEITSTYTSSEYGPMNCGGGTAEKL